MARRFTTPLVAPDRRRRLMLSALDLARRIEAGELTPRAGRRPVRRGDRRARGRDRRLRHARSRRRAQGCAADGLKDKPLRGLPVALKDIFDTADMPTEYGSPIYAGHRPSADAALVSLIRRAGGIAIGKTVTTEFAHLDPGKTRNPHNPDAHAGRLVVGLGRRRRGGLFADRDRHPDRRLGDPAGELLRRRRLQAVVPAAADRRHEMRVLASRHRRPVRRRRRRRRLRRGGHQRPRPARRRRARRPRRASRVLREHPWPAASADMAAAVDTAARAAAAGLARASATSRCRRCWRRRSGPTRTIHGYEAARSLAFEYDRHRDQLGKSMRELVESGKAISAEAYDDARRTASRARAAR